MLRRQSLPMPLPLPLPFLLSSFLLACSSTDVTAPADASANDAPSSTDARADTTTDATALDGSACKLVKPYSSKNVVCNQCAQAKCCTEINGCLGDPKCDDDYVNCILACSLLPPDGGADAGAAIKACIDQCGVDHPQGKAEYDVAIGCADTKCKVECQ